MAAIRDSSAHLEQTFTVLPQSKLVKYVSLMMTP
jgi:hypothetical protein